MPHEKHRPIAAPRGPGAGRGVWGLALVVSVVAAVGLLVGIGAQPDDAPAGPRVYEPGVHVSPATTGAIDLEQVHRRMWADWVAAPPALAADREEAMRVALAPDANLSALFDEMMHAVRSGVAQNTEELLYLVWAWNTYLDRQGQPWRLSAGVQLNGKDAAVFYVKTYEVIHDSQTWVGPQATRTRVVQRVDDLNVVEGYLGLTSDHEQGAVVVADRVSELALDRIWPLLDDSVDPERSALDAVFAPVIRESLREHLAPDVWRELSETADDRFWLLAVVDAIHARASCGNAFRIGEMPYNGLSDADLAVVRRFAAATQGTDCPDVTDMEAIALVIRSRQLRKREGLRTSLRALGAMTARSIAIHEARHAADDVAGAPDCPSCPSVLDGITRLEANAYLTSFADPVTGHIALYQACGVADQNVAGRGPSIRWLSDQLGDACNQGPPDDLPRRARDLRWTLFGSPSLVMLHESFPDYIPVP